VNSFPSDEDTSDQREPEFDDFAADLAICRRERDEAIQRTRDLEALVKSMRKRRTGKLTAPLRDLHGWWRRVKRARKARKRAKKLSREQWLAAPIERLLGAESETAPAAPPAVEFPPQPIPPVEPPLAAESETAPAAPPVVEFPSEPIPPVEPPLPAESEMADAPQPVATLAPTEPAAPAENPAARRLDELRAQALAEIGAEGPEVAVVIPCFNYGHFLTEAVESVLAQSYPHCRVVVVDDGSGDAHTVHICDSLASERVTVIHKTNQGLSAARNTGAANTDAPFLMFLDADDRLQPDAVAFKLWSLLRNPDAAYVYSSQRFFGDDNLVWEPQVFNGYDLLFANHPSVCALIRRSAYLATRGYSTGMVVGYEDWCHWLMLLARGLAGRRLRAPLFEHRRHGRTMTHEAHERRKLLHRKLWRHAPSLYTVDALSATKAQWRPAVSIAMPCFNNAIYLDETIASVRAQTTYDFELILVDDGSTDPAAITKLKEIEAVKDTFGFRVLVLWEPHRGLPGARNAAVARARGEYVYMLDSDDLIAPTTIEKLVLFAQLHPGPSFVYSAVRHFGAIEGICADVFDGERLKRENFLTGTSLLPRALYESIGGLDEALVDSYEDYDLWLRLLAAGHYGKLLNETLFSYRRHNRGNRSALEGRKTHEEMIATLHARHPSLYGGPEPDRATWKLFLPPRAADKIEAEAETLLTSVLADERGLERQSYRRRITPDMFSPRAWRREKLNILYLVPYFVCGGAERVDLDIVAGFVKQGHQVTLVAGERADQVWRERFEALSPDVFLLPELTDDADGVDAVIDYLMIARAVDVVFVRHSGIGYRLSERWRAITSQVRFVDLLHLHANGQDWVRASAICNDYLDKRIVITEDLKTYACDTYHLAAERFEVIYNGLDFDALPEPADHAQAKHRICNQFGLDPAKPLVGFCGRFAEQKDPLRWVEAFALAARDNPDLQGLLIGDGELEAYTKARAALLGVADKLVFGGYRDDAREIIAGFDVLLLTSLYEGLPTVVLEAMAAGVPAVATDVGGTRECFGGSISRLLPLSAPDADFADAIRAVLAELDRDPQTREECRARIRRQFDLGRMQEAYGKAIEAVAAGLDRKLRCEDYLDRLMERAPLG